MLEGLPPNNATRLMRLRSDQAIARRVADFMVENFDAAEVAACAFEEPRAPGDRSEPVWLVEVFFVDAIDDESVREFIAIAAGDAVAAAAEFDAVAQKDWIAASLEGLQPVEAGRFVVHGSHDRGRLAGHKIALEIEAALAFGTGHHGTTRGCLLALDSILKRRRPERVLDVGTGTGVLAMAAAKALRRPVASGDIDATSVQAARDNARLNGVAPYVRPVCASGVGHPAIKAGAPYDLIFANILAPPLRRLAPGLAGVATADADLVLSGLLERDVAGVLFAYAMQGFRLAQRWSLEGWATLRLRRGGASPRPMRDMMELEDL